MALVAHNTQERAVYIRVNYSPIIAFLHVLRGRFAARNHPHVRDLTAHMARDAGIPPGILARSQHRLPSQHQHHPRG